MSKKWETLNKVKSQKLKVKINDVINILLENRGLKTKKEVEEFLDSRLENVTIESVGIDKKQLKKTIKRIRKAIDEKEQIVVFGDYDVDGICGTAILWETLHKLGANVVPYIPHRIDEGYGLSLIGISNIKDQISNTKLIITVDNGIVASEAVDFANKQGMDVIITDHHVPAEKLPDAYAIVHTVKLCGTGVAWVLSNVILNSFQESNKISEQVRKDTKNDNHLELVALATVADLVPLKGANRTLLKYGLEKLRQTKRVGLLEIFKEAGIDHTTIGVYEIGHIIAPRLNAMGRLEYAMESLRLLCTVSQERAYNLAKILGETNKERQQLTMETVLHAKTQVTNHLFRFDETGNSQITNLLFISHETYQQGVIGLVAGKLVEEYYRPAIVVSKGEVHSKASARSVSGFNIIEFIRGASHLLVDAGGHPMAAGFTVETAKLALLQKTLEEKAMEIISQEILTRTLKIDCELPAELINLDLYEGIQKLTPFGMGNPEPVFVSSGLVIEDMRVVGREGKHLKIRIKNQKSNIKYDGIAFGMGERTGEFSIEDKVDIVYTIVLDTWNGNNRLQLKIKDIKKSEESQVFA